MQVSVQPNYEKIASIVGKGKMFETWKDKPEEALLAMYVGQSLGLSWFNSLANIAVIHGRPVVWGDALLAVCQKSKCMEHFSETFDEVTMTATCEVKRVGHPALTRQFSKSDAETACLMNKAVWKSYPKRMMQMRARAFALRDVFADILQGIGMVEEVQDYEVNQEPVHHIAEQPTKSAQLLQKGQFAKLEEVEEIQEAQEVQEERDEIENSIEPTSSDCVMDIIPTAFERKRDLVLARFEEMGADQSKILASLELESVEEIDASNLEHLINIGKGIKEGKGTINQAFC